MSRARHNTVEARLRANVDRSGGPDACWLWTAFVTPKGYGCTRSGGRNAPAHRVAYELAHGPIPDGLYVCHRCDVRACCNPAHLFLGTAKDNTQDMLRKGRQGAKTKPDFAVRGTAHPLAKLDEDAVRSIRARAAEDNATQTGLAALYGVHHSVIGAVIRRESWKHVD